MKTATFDYTDMAEVDSSFIDSVYYNGKSQELAVKMNSGSTHFYGPVPSRIFYDLVGSSSVGSTYNREVKDQYTNLGGGAVQDATFVMLEGVLKTFDVSGISVVTGTYRASSAAEAAKMFVAETSAILDNASVTEVTEVVY